MSTEPPVPIFNSFDNDSCKETVNEFYSWAVSTYEGDLEDKATLETSY